MAYEKFALNFTLIGQKVYEIITDQFTPIQVETPLNLMFAEKELSVYIEGKRI